MTVKHVWIGVASLVALTMAPQGVVSAAAQAAPKAASATDASAANPITNEQQFFQCAVQPKGLAAILQRTAQSADQGIAKGQETVAA